MTTDDRTTKDTTGVPQYEIRVQGRLGPRWTAWFDGLTLVDEEGGVTVIRGPVVDQAALHGLLQKLRDVGIPLVSLAQLPPDAATAPQRPEPRKGTDMTTTTRTPMSPTRKAALIAGVAYLATFVFSIPVKFGLWADVLDKPDFVLGAGSDAGIAMGALFEVLTALGGVVSAVALYGVARRHSERAALGFVTTRVLEAAMIFVGVLSILAVFTLRQDLTGTAGADPGALLTAGNALVSIHDWAFLLGPGLMAVLNALLIGSVMYRSGLLPRWIPTVGLVGAPLLFVSFIGTLFGAWDQLSTAGALCAVPIAVWEFSFGVHMTAKGFRPAPAGSESIDDAVAMHTVAA